MSMPTEYKLDNGLTVIYEYIPGVKVVSVQCWIKTGSINDTDKHAGISHFLEHILFKGTKKFKAGELDAYLDSKGGYNNAFTSWDVTNYHVTIPTDEAEAAFEVVSDMVFDALFIPEEIEKEKPVVLQEIKRSYDDPTYDMWADAQKQLMGGTPYERKIIGKAETVSALTRQDLLDYYNKYYHPKNMNLIIVGDISEKDARKLAEKYFSKTREVEVGKGYDGSSKVTFNKPVDKVFESDVNVEYAFFGFPADKQTLETIYADEVLAEVLSSGEYSILNEELRKKKNIVIYADGVEVFNKYHGFFGIVGEFLPGNAEKFKKEALKILDDIKNGKLDEKRIERAKNRLISRKLFEAENVSSLANDLGFAYALGFKDYCLNYTKGIEAVKKDDIVKSVKRLTNHPMYFARTVPKKNN